MFFVCSFFFAESVKCARGTGMQCTLFNKGYLTVGRFKGRLISLHAWTGFWERESDLTRLVQLWLWDCWYVVD